MKLKKALECCTGKGNIMNQSFSISRDSAVCRKCKHYNDCDNKRMEACGVLLYAASFDQQLTSPILEDMAVKHDYRNVKIAENTTVTIDLEEIKKNLRNEIYKSLHCNFLRSD